MAKAKVNRRGTRRPQWRGHSNNTYVALFAIEMLARAATVGEIWDFIIGHKLDANMSFTKLSNRKTDFKHTMYGTLNKAAEKGYVSVSGSPNHFSLLPSGRTFIEEYVQQHGTLVPAKIQPSLAFSAPTTIVPFPTVAAPQVSAPSDTVVARLLEVTGALDTEIADLETSLKAKREERRLLQAIIENRRSNH